MKSTGTIALATWLLLTASSPALAQGSALSARDSFRIGDAGVLCTAQYAPADARLTSIFDRGYKLVCRDAAGAVGSLLALRGAEAAPPMSAASLQCAAPMTELVDRLGSVEMVSCRSDTGGLDYRRYRVRRGDTTYLAEGLAGYDSALRYGLAALVADRPVAGTIEVATTLISDPAAFASVQAGVLDARSARREAYGRNNGASFAQSAAFFESLAMRSGDDASDQAEFTANQGLQLSNLGNFNAAATMFRRAERLTPARDGVTQRMIRNFRAIDALNRKLPETALQMLAVPVAPVRPERADELRDGRISEGLAQAINRENETLKSLGGIEAGLTGEDRAAILDGQALQLRGSALRQQGKDAEARTALDRSLLAITQVRDGRVTSVSWLKSQILSDLSTIAEKTGDTAAADAYLLQAIAIYRVDFPSSPALLATMARRAGLLSRTGKEDEAVALFRSVIDESDTVDDAAAALRELIQPYFDLLALRSDNQSAADLFKASQILQRPGVAQTQAVLARELSEGNDAAAALFRLSVARSRDIVRTKAEIDILAEQPALTEDDRARLAQARETMASLSREQTEIQSKLAAFPRYRAAAPSGLSLSDLQSTLRPGEVYYKTTVVEDRAFAQFVTADSARSFRIARTVSELDGDVVRIRDSIVRLEGGATVTYPFDLAGARSMFKSLFGPVESELVAAKHVIFEPDGPLLQLPPYLLVTDDKSLATYERRQQLRDADEFDFRDVAWLGRDRSISIAVSPRAFVDVRKIAPSQGRRPYLGLGRNKPVDARPVMAVADECDWPIAVWRDPISADELRLASSLVGGSPGAIITDDDFSDSALAARSDLADFRILHFATHGLVTASRPGCPARPALVTSFGKGDSDGLLSFREVFDLKLDADVVILSACDTAGMATANVTREAGITTGGNYALDGLVRAFVGAGARSVLASHWPVPDDFDATGRLVGGLFRAKPGLGLSEALRETQRGLMDDAATSHPYYWAAFVVLGDGTKPMVASR